MKVFTIDVRIAGTAYIVAESAERAEELLKQNYHSDLHVDDDTVFSDEQYDEMIAEDIERFTLAPIMTLYGRFNDGTEFEEVYGEED